MPPNQDYVIILCATVLYLEYRVLVDIDGKVTRSVLLALVRVVITDSVISECSSDHMIIVCGIVGTHGTVDRLRVPPRVM